MIRTIIKFILGAVFILSFGSASPGKERNPSPDAAEILGNPAYPAFSYGGYRNTSRQIEPSVNDLKEDLRIMEAMGIKIIRTYNTQLFPQIGNLLQAISELKKSDPSFEMYVMLGAWIECKGAFTPNPDHNEANETQNKAEIDAAVAFAKKYPDIIKIIAVGNEAMVQWAVSYFVYPKVILQWVNYLQQLKATGALPKSLWITSSDNFASWGGGDAVYHTKDLESLIKAVDFVSLHTYPFHDTYYNPAFWGVPKEEESLSDTAKVQAAMLRARDYAIAQYKSTADYIKSVGVNKPIHIGETGWASAASANYGATGSKAADEYKSKLFFDHMREWTVKSGISCFYFEVFDEPWKDPSSALGSENHFGLIDIHGKAKYALWKLVDDGAFKGLTRNGVAITKSYDGNAQAVLADMLIPPSTREMGILEVSTVNTQRKPGELITENKYVVSHPGLVPNGNNNLTYPSARLKLNAWEGTCSIKMSDDGIIEIATGSDKWWGCALEIQSAGENLSDFKKGYLHFDIKGTTAADFDIGFQTGNFAKGTQVSNSVAFGPGKKYAIKNDWVSWSIPVSELNKGGNMADVTGILFLKGNAGFDGKQILLKNIYYSQQ